MNECYGEWNAIITLGLHHMGVGCCRRQRQTSVLEPREEFVRVWETPVPDTTAIYFLDENGQACSGSHASSDVVALLTTDVWVIAMPVIMKNMYLDSTLNDVYYFPSSAEWLTVGFVWRWAWMSRNPRHTVSYNIMTKRALEVTIYQESFFLHVCAVARDMYTGLPITTQTVQVFTGWWRLNIVKWGSIYANCLGDDGAWVVCGTTRSSGFFVTSTGILGTLPKEFFHRSHFLAAPGSGFWIVDQKCIRGPWHPSSKGFLRDLERLPILYRFEELTHPVCARTSCERLFIVTGFNDRDQGVVLGLRTASEFRRTWLHAVLSMNRFSIERSVM